MNHHHHRPAATAADEHPEISRHAERLLLTPPEAAALLSISRTTLYYLARDGDLTPIRIGRATRFAITDLERFIAHRLAA